MVIFGHKKLSDYWFGSNKNRDINLRNIYLIFYQNCDFLATHVDARSWNGDFSLSPVESSRCAVNWQTRFWKLKLKSNKLVDLRNLYPNMVVFYLNCLFFLSWLRTWTWKYRFPKLMKILLFFVLNPQREFACIQWGGSRGDDYEISAFLASKSYQNITFDKKKKKKKNGT